MNHVARVALLNFSLEGDKINFYIMLSGAGHVHLKKTSIVRYVRNVFTVHSIGHQNDNLTSLLFCSLETKGSKTTFLLCPVKLVRSLYQNN